MKLSQLIKLLDRPVVSGPVNMTVHAVTADSRTVQTGAIFAAVKGESADGNGYVAMALQAGAVAVLSERAPQADFPADKTWIHVADSRRALAVCAVALAGNPAAKMKMCGITGTNGKTTSAFLVHYLMKKSLIKIYFY